MKTKAQRGDPQPPKARVLSQSPRHLISGVRRPAPGANLFLLFRATWLMVSRDSKRRKQPEVKGRMAQGHKDPPCPAQAAPPPELGPGHRVVLFSGPLESKAGQKPGGV